MRVQGPGPELPSQLGSLAPASSAGSLSGEHLLPQASLGPSASLRASLGDLPLQRSSSAMARQAPFTGSGVQGPGLLRTSTAGRAAHGACRLGPSASLGASLGGLAPQRSSSAMARQARFTGLGVQGPGLLRTSTVGRAVHGACRQRALPGWHGCRRPGVCHQHLWKDSRLFCRWCRPCEIAREPHTEVLTALGVRRRVSWDTSILVKPFRQIRSALGPSGDTAPLDEVTVEPPLVFLDGQPRLARESSAPSAPSMARSTGDRDDAGFAELDEGTAVIGSYGHIQ